LNDLGFAPRETDHDDTFAEEEQDLKNAKRIALIAGGLVSLASVLMILRVWQGASPIFVFGQAILAVLPAAWPPSSVLRSAWQSRRRGILHQGVVAASAAVGGLVGGVTGLIWPAFPADGFCGATTFILASHCVGGFASSLVHVRSPQSV